MLCASILVTGKATYIVHDKDVVVVRVQVETGHGLSEGKVVDDTVINCPPLVPLVVTTKCPCSGEGILVTLNPLVNNTGHVMELSVPGGYYMVNGQFVRMPAELVVAPGNTSPLIVSQTPPGTTSLTLTEHVLGLPGTERTLTDTVGNVVTIS